MKWLLCVAATEIRYSFPSECQDSKFPIVFSKETVLHFLPKMLFTIFPTLFNDFGPLFPLPWTLIFSNYVCLQNITSKRHLQGKQHFNRRIPPHTVCQLATTSARTSMHASTTVAGRQFQMSVFCWEKAKVPLLNGVCSLDFNDEI